MRKLIFAISSLVLILVPAAILYSKRPTAIASTGAVKTFAVEARMWGWTPATIEVEEGDRVVLDITTKDVKHGLNIPALDLDVELPAGKTTHVEFVAKQSGDYRFMCSRWCFADPAKSTGHNYMEGKLIVRPKAGTTHTIEVTEFYGKFFDPRVMHVKPGDSVRWVMGSRAHSWHTVTSWADSPMPFDSGVFKDVYEVKFDKPGLYKYFCHVHPLMRGIVAVDAQLPSEKDQQRFLVYPPEDGIPGPTPKVAGVGEVWAVLQWAEHPEKKWPGATVVIDSATWQIKDIITAEHSNPHGLFTNKTEDKVWITNWQSRSILTIDRKTHKVINRAYPGDSIAHALMHPNGEKLYVSRASENLISVLNPETLKTTKDIQLDNGPHGIWITPNGKWLVAAAVLDDKLSVIDAEKDEFSYSIPTKRLPLFAFTTLDSRYGMVAAALDKTVHIVDLNAKKQVAAIEAGAFPIWPAPAPDGKHIMAINTGTHDISVIEIDTWKIVKTIPNVGWGAHGMSFGLKQGGGWYGYVVNKFTHYITVVDMQSLMVAGYIPLPPGYYGGISPLAFPRVKSVAYPYP